jgi:outer membrane protein OmpU
VKLSGYARFGAVWTEGTPAAAATQGVHTAASAAIVNAAPGGGGVAAGDPVIAAHSTALINNLTAAQATAAAAAHNQASATALATANAAVTAAAAAIAASAGTPATAAVADSTDVASRVRFQLDASTTNGARFGLTYNGLSLNVGNINGVIESTPNLYMNTNSAGVGLEGNGFHSLATNNAGGSFGWTAYSSGGAGATNGVEVIYSMSGIRLHAHSTETSSALGASYTMGDITVAAGKEEFDGGASITLVTAGMNFSNGWVALAWGEHETAAGVKTDKTALKGGVNLASGTSVYGFAATEKAGGALGVGVSYDLGGGAAFDAGYTKTAADRGILSAGIFFTF